MGTEILFGLYILEVHIMEPVVWPAMAVGVSAYYAKDSVKAWKEYLSDPHYYNKQFKQDFKEKATDVALWPLYPVAFVDAVAGGGGRLTQGTTKIASSLLGGMKRDEHSSAEEHEQSVEQATTNAAVWFHGDDLTAEEMRLLKGLRIDPDDDRAGTATFTLDNNISDGTFYGLTKPAVDGILHGNFSTEHPLVPFPVEGTWIVINETLASNETSKGFNDLKSSLSSGKKQAEQEHLFQKLIDAAGKAEIAEQKQREKQEGEQKDEQIKEGTTVVHVWEED